MVKRVQKSRGWIENALTFFKILSWDNNFEKLYYLITKILAGEIFISGNRR